MAWDDIARHDHRRVCARYPSDMTDREWAIIAPLLPPARSGGRPRTVDLRAVLDAILFIASSGCQWRMLPKDFPPRSTVQGYFYDWRDSRLWETINQLLVMSARELEGREASPTAGVIDSQSVKTTESGGLSGYDAGKKIKGRKRHIATDTLGLMLFVLVHAADVQDRDGAPALLQAIRHRFPWLRHIFADGGYAGRKLRDALKGQGDWTIEIIKRSDTATGFEVLPRRWVVERTLALILSLSKEARPVPTPRQGLGENHRKLHRLGSRGQHQTPLTQTRKILLSYVNFRVGHLEKAMFNRASTRKNLIDRMDSFDGSQEEKSSIESAILPYVVQQRKEYDEKMRQVHLWGLQRLRRMLQCGECAVYSIIGGRVSRFPKHVWSLPIHTPTFLRGTLGEMPGCYTFTEQIFFNETELENILTGRVVKYDTPEFDFSPFQSSRLHVEEGDSDGNARAGLKNESTVGRRPKPYWDDIWIETCRVLVFDGAPPTQGKLIEHLQSWCLNRFGEEPGTSTLKRHTNRLWKELGFKDQNP